MSRRIVPATPAHAGRKPRVLLVDDHRQVLDMVAAVLSPEFDIVGAASDGRQAIAEAARLKPDVIVMDVEMPGLDGFQTLRALADGASRPVPPVVFLSMHGDEEVVSKAFRHGGQGYVLKRRAARDLATALEQVLLGRQFLPSLGPLLPAGGHTHVMQIYGRVESFAEQVAAVFDAALRRGEATCAIATRPLRDRLGDRLRARGWNVDELSGHKRCLLIDAAGAISRFMRNGLPDRGCLAEVARELEAYRRVESNGGASPLTLVGNMVVSLCEDDNPAAAVALESHWNDLTRDLPFLTICGYSTSCFHRRGVPHLWRDACAEHGALSHADDV